MLGARTKQVFAYGRRNQRIVNVTEDRPNRDHSATTVVEPFDSPVLIKRATQRAVSKPKPLSPKAAVAQRRKKASPVKAKKPTSRVKQLAESDSLPRSPLGAYSPNAPGSPAALTGIRKAPSMLSGAKGLPSSLRTPFSPFVDVDITVVDDDGKVLKKERRSSRTDVQTNPLGNTRVRTSRMTKPVVISLLSDDSPSPPRRARKKKPPPLSPESSFDQGDTDSQPIPAKGRLRRARLNRVVSDDEDDEILSNDSFHPSALSSDSEADTVEDSPLPTRRARSRKAALDHEAQHAYSPAHKPLQPPISPISIHTNSSHGIPAHTTPNPPSVPFVDLISPPPPSSPKLRGNTPIFVESSPEPSVVDSSHAEIIDLSLISDDSPAPQPIHGQPRLAQAKAFDYNGYIHSPAPRARQLTPIRRPGHTKVNPIRHQLFPRPPSPPSPTTPTDFDLSCDFSGLSLGADPAFDYIPPAHLVPLLEECSQLETGPHEFSSFINSFPFDPVVNAGGGGNGSKVEFRKIGEASYSEVFGIGNVVLKIVPLRNEDAPKPSDNDEDGPPPSDAADVLKEIIVTRAMGDMCPSFVKLLKTYVVRGRYPELLLTLWDEYDSRKGSESIRPDTFAVSQTYAIIVLPNGGPDLEAYVFTNASKTGWKQACSLFWQVAKALGKAEELVRFEHRDLHWGQILVRNEPPPPANVLGTRKTMSNMPDTPRSSRTNIKAMDDPVHGIHVTLIDLGLSRMDAGDGQHGKKVIWTEFDEEVFGGEGEYQFDIYRLMRMHNGDSWEVFSPLTNVLWLHYLSLKLLKSKRLKAPRKPAANGQSATTPALNKPFSERECYDCLVETEKLLAKSVAFVKKGSKSMKGKSAESLKGPASSIEVVAYGVKRLWIKL